MVTCSKKVVTSVRERLCGSPEEQPSPWLWQHQQGTTASRDSTDSAVSGSTVPPPQGLVPSTQEHLPPPVTTTITNMTNAFTVSVLQTGDGKIFVELRVN